MAKADVRDFLTCQVCLDTFREPVTMGCHHSFCSSCLKDFWDQSKTKHCPICRRKSSKDDPSINFALKELSISFRKKTAAQKEKDQEKPTHPEVSPQTKSQEELKEQLRSELETLTKQREKLSDTEKLYDDMVQLAKKQAVQCERQIRVLFSRLHQFLKEEEHRAVETLREEQQRQAHTLGPELGRLREQLASVDDTIQDLKGLLQRDTVLHYSLQHPLQSTPAPGPGLLLDQAKVLGNLGFRVWKRMRSEVSYSPVILDPNTAGRSLNLSEDLSAVRQGDIYQQLPDNLERHSKCSIVLGSEGFSSGTHQWDVEVGDHPAWSIGVAKESVNRKEKIYVSPKYGIWCLRHGEGRYANGCRKPVPVQKAPVKIRVKLDCDTGEVSFYDTDHMTHLYTHKHTCTEKLFPYFYIGQAGDAETKEIKICPTE